MLDFRIDTFLAVCKFMNFTKASLYLNITQPAVSSHIFKKKISRYEDETDIGFWSYFNSR